MTQQITVHSNPPTIAVSVAKIYTVTLENRKYSVEVQVNRPALSVAGAGGVTLTPAALAALGVTTTVDGYGEIGIWDANTQARIAAKLAAGWPEDSIIINYLGVSEAGVLAANNGVVTPAGTAADLTAVGAVSTDNGIVTPVGNAADLIPVGAVSADNGIVTPSGGVADLVGEGALAADSGTATPAGDVATLIGELLSDNGTVTPVGVDAELTQATALAADNGTVTPAGQTAGLNGILTAANGTVTPTGTAGELTGEDSALYVNTTFDTVLSPFVNRGGWSAIAGKAVNTAGGWMDAPISVNRSTAGFYVDTVVSLAVGMNAVIYIETATRTEETDLAKSSYQVVVSNWEDEGTYGYALTLNKGDSAGSLTQIGFWEQDTGNITNDQLIRLEFTSTTITVKQGGTTRISAVADTTFMSFVQLAYQDTSGGGNVSVNSVAMGEW